MKTKFKVESVKLRGPAGFQVSAKGPNGEALLLAGLTEDQAKTFCEAKAFAKGEFVPNVETVALALK